MVRKFMPYVFIFTMLICFTPVSAGSNFHPGTPIPFYAKDVAPTPTPIPTIIPSVAPGAKPSVIPVTPTVIIPSPTAAPSPEPTVTPVFGPTVTPEEKTDGQTAELKKKSEKFIKDINQIVNRNIDSFYKRGGKGVIGVYVKQLKTGFEYGYNDSKVNGDKPKEGYFDTASTCKLMSSAVFYYLDTNSKLDLDQKYYDSVTRASYDMRKLLYRMITHSVNDYFNITLRYLGSKKINETLQELGVRNSFAYSEIMPAKGTSTATNYRRYGVSRAPRTNPRDLGHILDLLYEGKTFGAQNNVKFAESLKGNIYSNRLPQGISYKSPVGHKTGTNPAKGVYNDAGIIYLKDNPYIMVVMSKGSQGSVQAMYRQMAKDIYNYMKTL